MINTIDKQEALESIIEENLFKTPFMVELFGDEEPEYDFDHDTRPDTDDARNRVMKAQILVEVKADEEAISKIEKDYNTYFNKLKAWAKPFEAEYYVDSILTTDNSITFVFDVPAQEDFWEPGKYLNQEDEDELAENGKEIYTQDTVKVSNKKHPLYDYEGKVLSFHGEGKGKHAEVLLSNGDTEIIKVSDLKDIDSYILSLDKENLKELTETKLSAYCMDNATDKKNAMKAIDKAEGISGRTKEKAKDILVFNESWCLDDSTDQKRFYKKVFTQNWLHTNKYITGLNLSEYSTDAPDGVLMGFDSDSGEMVSYKGKLISKSDLPEKITIRKINDKGELEEVKEVVIKSKGFVITSKDQPNDLFIGQDRTRITWVESWRKPKIFSTEKEANDFNDKIDMNGKVVPYQKIKAANGKEIEDGVDEAIDEAYLIFNASINNGGTLDYGEKRYGYLNDLLDSIEIGYKHSEPDGDEQEALSEQGFEMTAQEVIDAVKHELDAIKDIVGEDKFNKVLSQKAANGKEIYEGKTKEQVWNSWTEEQRIHFIKDHDKNNLYNAEEEALLDYDDIHDTALSDWIGEHMSMGSYSDGGGVSKSEKITYKIYDGDKLVFTTSSANKASDYRVMKGKHLSVIATYSNGDTRKIYDNGGPINESDLSTLKKGFSIKWFREYLNKNFRDSFGFTVNKPKKGTQAEQLIPDDEFRGIKDDSLILSFPSNRGMCYNTYQGSENTYFNFVLYDKDSNGYVGGFGFKDDGDVDPEYITRFVALLMQAYGYPFTVKHTVAANGKKIKEKGNIVIVHVPDETGYSKLGGGQRNNEDIEKYISSNSFVKQIEMSSGKSMDAGKGRIKTLKFTLSDNGHFESAQDFINDIENSVTVVGEILSKAANGSLLEYTEYGHSDGEKTYTRSQAIKRIKTILKDDKDILNGRILSEISDDDIIEIGFNHYGFDYYQAADGSIIRADKSSLLKYVNFEDNWHINLLELNPNRNQNGLKYKNNNKYAVSRTSDKGKRKVYEFETLEKAENKFNDLVTESKTFSNVSKEGTTSNYAANGAVIGEFLEEENGLSYFKNDKGKIVITGGHGVVYDKKFDTLDEAKEHIKEENAKNPNFYIGIAAANGAEISSYKKQLTEALEKKYNVNISDTGFDDTHIKLAMDKNESIDDVVSFIGNTYKLTPIQSTSSSSSGKKSYICVIKDKAGNELGSYPVTHTDDKYLDEFLKAIGVKMRASDTRKIEQVEEV